MSPTTRSHDRSVTELALRGSMLDALGEAVVAADQEGRILYWNPAAADLFGWRAAEVTGSGLVDVIAADGMEPEAGAILDRVRSTGGWSGELLLRHREGRVFPALATVSRVRDPLAGSDAGPDAGPVAYVVVARDISTQREAEASARDAEARLELMRRAAPSVIYEWDLGTDAVHWSDDVTDAFGYAADEIEPSLDWWAARIHPDDRDRVTESFHRFADGGARFWTEEYRFRTAEGGYALVYDRAYIGHGDDGRPARVTGTMVDLTERRRLHDEQRLLSQASMILELSLDYQSTLPTLARLAATGVCDYCIIGISDGDDFPGMTAAAHADARLQALMDELAGYLHGGPPEGSLLERAIRTGEAAVLRRLPYALVAGAVPRGRLRELARDLEPESLIFVPLRARQVSLGYMVLASTSPDRIYQAQDLRLAEELGRRLALTIDHARLFHSAELANRAKSDFLAVISHELRTPLTAVSGYADLLAEQVSGPLNDTQRRQVGRIRAGADRLLRLIDGILVYARLETGRERVRRQAVDAAELLARVEELVAPRAAEKDVRLLIDPAGMPPTLRADPDKLGRILLSLLSNAVKFTDRGAVTLHVSCDDERVRFDVSDSGRGIAPEHLPHVFNPFWQAEQPTTRRAGGAGLGLSVARRLARLMGGEVHITESGPAGTTIRFELPHAESVRAG